MNLVLRIKKRTPGEWVTLFVLMMPFSFGLLISLLGLPNAVKYVIDLAWIVLLAILIKGRFAMANRESVVLLRFVAAFLLFTLVGFIINLQTPLYYLWGFRNNFRFFIFFFACVALIEYDDIPRYLKLLDVLFYVNAIISFIQYFAFGIKQDFLGGIFGVEEGSNGLTVIFLAIVVIKDLVQYLNHQTTVKLLLFKCALALAIAAMAELKFFYVLFVIVVILTVLMTHFTYKKLAVVVFSIIGVYVGTMALTAIFPTWENWFSIENILETALSTEGYTGLSDMNRLTALPMTWGRFLTTLPKQLFGLGLGNCDTSAFPFLNTPFFEANEHLHYNWFSTSFAMLEMGLIGLILYVTFFVLVYRGASSRRKSHQSEEVYCQCAKVLVVVSLILIVYNQSMRTEAAYMMYFMLALPFIQMKSSSVT